MKKVFACSVIAVCALIAGCAKPLEVSSITEIKPPPGTQGVDVYAARRASGEKVPDFAGDQIVEVRTYASADASASEEFPGASCKLTTRDFSADFVSPAKVRVPVYRAQSSPLAVSCEKEGYKPKLAEVVAFNATKEGRLNNAAGAGAAGVLVMALVNAASDETTHDFQYPLVRVIMEKNAPPAKPNQTANAAQ